MAPVSFVKDHILTFLVMEGEDKSTREIYAYLVKQYDHFTLSALSKHLRTMHKKGILSAKLHLGRKKGGGLQKRYWFIKNHDYPFLIMRGRE